VAQQAGQISPDGKWLWNGAQWVPYQQPPVAPVAVPWARPYESARHRTMWVSILLASTIAGVVLLTASTIAIDLEGDSAHLSDSQTLAIGVLALVGAVAYFGTFIPSVVLFCMWLHRVVRNMPALGAPDPRWSPAGAVGRCFVPILNLFHPLYGTLDAWRGADPTRRVLGVQARKTIRPPRLIASWWALWLIGGYLSRIATSSTGTTGVVLDSLTGVALIGAPILAILVVRDVTTRQDRKNELIASGQLA
jgi:hypothetical protein